MRMALVISERMPVTVQNAFGSVALSMGIRRFVFWGAVGWGSGSNTVSNSGSYFGSGLVAGLGLDLPGSFDVGFLR